jgi:hypothetical protein
MITEKINQITFYYSAEEQHDAEIIRKAISKITDVLSNQYNLHPPADCRVILMTDWHMFLEEGAPPLMKIFLPLIESLQGKRFEATWKVAGGWNQRMGSRQVTGIKPGRLIESADRRLGEEIFNPYDSIEEKVFSVTCHELTHAFTDALRLPSWLHEGLAMVFTDHAMNKETVNRETLTILKDSDTGRITRFSLNEEKILGLLYVRGYWLTRWLELENPDLLNSWLRKKLRPSEIDQQLAKKLNLQITNLWSMMDHFLAEYFLQN